LVMTSLNESRKACYHCRRRLEDCHHRRRQSRACQWW
jgi:hypothetical protein